MQEGRTIRNLALVGFMGTGKSSVGRCVAARLRFRFVDTDVLVERRAGLKIGEIFERQGEAAFREHERRAIQELESQPRLVIATGGGAIAQPANFESLRRHALIVCLWASAEVIMRRVGGTSHRPLLRTADPLGRIRELLDQRRSHYCKADVLVDTERRSVAVVAQQVVHHFRLAARSPTKAVPR